METFRAMSNLVADADDLVFKLGNARSPEVRALKEKIEVAVADMKERLRQKVRGSAYAGTTDTVPSVAMASPWIVILIGAGLAVALLSAVNGRRAMH